MTMVLRSENVGPARGEHVLGEIKGPGLYFLVADNAQGKSRHLDLLLRLQGEAKATGTEISDGELSATLQFGQAKISFHRSPVTGQVLSPEREGELKVEAMPAAIETLITGDHLTGKEARARRRLGALLLYAPIEPSDEMLAQLCGCLQERSWSEGIQPSLLESWATLLPAIKAGSGKAKPQGPMQTDQISNWLRGQRPKTLLDAHDQLRELLNSLGNTAEKLAEEQARRVAATGGRRKHALDMAVLQLGGTPAATESVLRQPHDKAKADADFAAAVKEQEGVRSRLAAHRAETERRERVRAAHGERPRCNKAAVQAIVTALRSDFDELLSGVFDEHGEVRFRDDVNRAAMMGNRVREGVTELLQTVHSPDLAMETIRWDAVEAELSSPLLPAPTEAEVLAADIAANAAAGLAQVAQHAAAFRELDQEHEAAVMAQGRLETAAADYRAAAADSWAELGAIVTAHLKLPWLQVDGLDIFVGYVGDALNDDPELLAEAEKAARLAVEDQFSAVSLRRFMLRRIREASTVQWRSLDDHERISTGELHEACLALMLSRRGGGGQVLVVPWAVTAALDAGALAALAGKLSRAGIIGLSERPRRAGDREGLFLEEVAR